MVTFDTAQHQWRPDSVRQDVRYTPYNLNLNAKRLDQFVYAFDQADTVQWYQYFTDSTHGTIVDTLETHYTRELSHWIIDSRNRILFTIKAFGPFP